MFTQHQTWSVCRSLWWGNVWSVGRGALISGGTWVHVHGNMGFEMGTTDMFPELEEFMEENAQWRRLSLPTLKPFWDILTSISQKIKPRKFSKITPYFKTEEKKSFKRLKASDWRLERGGIGCVTLFTYVSFNWRRSRSIPPIPGNAACDDSELQIFSPGCQSTLETHKLNNCVGRSLRSGWC